jgi:hypothetical protein
MELRNRVSDIVNGLNGYQRVYRAIIEIIPVKIGMPSLSIRAAQKRGFLNFSNSYYYTAINELGNIVIKEKISLEEFLPDITTNVKIADATLHKRAGKKVYGAKKLKNYVLGGYGLYQDILFTTERFEGMDYIIDFKVINHNKRHLTKPKEIEKAIKSGKIKAGDWIIIDGGLKSGKIAKEARRKGVKLVTRLDKNFVVTHLKDVFGKGLLETCFWYAVKDTKISSRCSHCEAMERQSRSQHRSVASPKRL